MLSANHFDANVLNFAGPFSVTSLKELNQLQVWTKTVELNRKLYNTVDSDTNIDL